MPISVLEAMACGVPVLLSDIAPHREIAKHGNFIPLLKTDDVAGFARELARFRACRRVKEGQLASNAGSLLSRTLA